MKQEIRLAQFTGPLDLLLQLIEQKELEITTVSISEVTEQFLSYMEEMEERQPDELADFLVVATKLLLLKSHALLPYLLMEDEPDPGELEVQLRMYKKYVDAMRGIEAALQSGAFLHPKQSSKIVEVAFRPPQGVGVAELRALFVDVLEGLEPVVRIPKSAMQKVLSLREKLSQIEDLIESNVKLHFTELVANSADREDVVVTFLALLELIKKQTIHITQKGSFSDITIEKAN